MDAPTYNGIDVPEWKCPQPLERREPLPDDVTRFYHDRGFVESKVITVGSKLGCNEFVLRRL